jgi:hypothetical protein
MRRRLRLLRTVVVLIVLVALVLAGDRLRRHDPTASATRGAQRTQSARGPGTPRPASAPTRQTTTGPVASTTVPPASAASPTTVTTTTVTATTVPPPITTTSVDGANGVLAQRTIVSYLESCHDNITVAVYDVEDGRTSTWRSGVTEDEASISKVDILAALLHKDPSLDADDLSTATSMIEDSDDTSANDLWQDLGEGNAEAAFNRKIGLTDTKPGPGIDWGLTTTTAVDQVRLLRAVVLGTHLLRAASRHLELNLMENVEPSERWGVSSGVKSGATLAIKNGWLPLEDADWQINSIGWVDGQDRDYIIAVLTDDNGTEYEGISTIEGLSDLVWSAEGSHPKR